MNNQLVVIDNITIKQDAQGRYCLNDLHKASGEKSHQQPAKFMANQGTQALISEIGEQAVKVVRGRGKEQGTYVVKELVYAYAMWISPQFHLKVIRAYDRLATQGVAVADHAAADLLKNPLKYLEAIIGQAKELQARLEVVEPKAAVFDATVAVRKVSLGDFVRRFDGVNSNKIKSDLADHGYLYRMVKGYRFPWFHHKIVRGLLIAVWDQCPPLAPSR